MSNASPVKNSLGSPTSFGYAAVSHPASEIHGIGCSTGQSWTDNVYRYDGLASRVSTLESGGLTYYDWDSINVVQEKDADGDVTDRQVHGYAPIFSVGDIALMDKSGTPYVPVSDQVGTTWNLVNSTAAKANSYAYDAFGVARSASETVSNLYRFGTKRLDVAPALYHFIAREYGARLGRFASIDLLGRRLTWYVRFGSTAAGYMACYGPYGYAGGRPTSVADPLGLVPQWLATVGRTIVTPVRWAGQGVEAVGQGVEYVGHLSGYVPIVGGVTQPLLSAPGDVLQGAGNLMQGEWSQAGQNFLGAGTDLLSAGGSAFTSLWQAPQNVLGMGYAGVNLVGSGFGRLSPFALHHYEVTCCVDGEKVTQEVWVVEGPMPSLKPIAGISLGQVISVVPGEGTWPPGRLNVLPHELVHLFKQSRVMGASYLLNYLAADVMEGYSGSFMELEAYSEEVQFARNCSVKEL